MLDIQGREMFLTPAAEAAARSYVGLGGILLCGHRDIWSQAHAMAQNILQRARLHGDRQWIALTYKHGQFLQGVVDAHPEVTDVEDLTELLKAALDVMPSDQLMQISHHLLLPCPVFDGQPGSVADMYVRMLPGLTKFLPVEGGLTRCHVEFDDALPHNKHTQEV